MIKYKRGLLVAPSKNGTCKVIDALTNEIVKDGFSSMDEAFAFMKASEEAGEFKPFVAIPEGVPSAFLEEVANKHNPSKGAGTAAFVELFGDGANRADSLADAEERMQAYIVNEGFDLMGAYLDIRNAWYGNTNKEGERKREALRKKYFPISSRSINGGITELSASMKDQLSQIDVIIEKHREMGLWV